VGCYPDENVSPLFGYYNEYDEDVWYPSEVVRQDD